MSSRVLACLSHLVCSHFCVFDKSIFHLLVLCIEIGIRVFLYTYLFRSIWNIGISFWTIFKDKTIYLNQTYNIKMLILGRQNSKLDPRHFTRLYCGFFFWACNLVNWNGRLFLFELEYVEKLDQWKGGGNHLVLNVTVYRFRNRGSSLNKVEKYLF